MRIDDLLKLCRYYKGEDECPFSNTDVRYTAWKIESLFADLWPDSPMLKECLNDYIRRGLVGFCDYDDTPIHLKAFLMNRFFQYSERENIEVFKEGTEKVPFLK